MKKAPANAGFRAASVTVDGQRQSALSSDQRSERIFSLLEGALASGPDIVLLPEACWAYGLPWQEWTAEAEPRDGSRIRHIAGMARRARSYIAVPIFEIRRGSIFNTMLLIDRRGRIVWHYDKLFLTESERRLNFRPGRAAVPFDADFGRVGAAICFDLNFEELAAHWHRMHASVILFPSMFRAGRLLESWALRAGAYMISAASAEGSRIVDPLGRTLARSGNYSPVITCELPRSFAVLHIDRNESAWSEMQRRYGSRIHLEVASEEGRFILESRDRRLPVELLIRRHSLVPLRDYLDGERTANPGASRALAGRRRPAGENGPAN